MRKLLLAPFIAERNNLVKSTANNKWGGGEGRQDLDFCMSEKNSHSFDYLMTVLVTVQTMSLAVCGKPEVSLDSFLF